MLKAIAQLVSPKNSEDAKILQELHQASARLEAARILTEKQEMLAVEASHAALEANRYIDYTINKLK